VVMKRTRSCCSLDGPLLLRRVAWSSSVSAACFFTFILSIISHYALVVVNALPPGFEDENVVHIDQVVDMAFAGNVMLAVAKPGVLYTFDLEDPNADRQVAADLSERVCSNGERG